MTADAAHTPPDSAGAVRRPRVLVVAGRDPSGAGIDADRGALEGLSVEALFVVTAFTDQDASGVRSIGAVDARRWLDEALAHVERGVDAVKFGLLPGADHVSAATCLVNAARARHSIPCVVDPVLAASSGGRFIDARGVEALRTELFRAGVIATPNLLEAAELARVSAESILEPTGARLAVATRLMDMGLEALVLKAGHGREDPARDLVIAAGRAPTWLTHTRIVGGNVRGSGCRFASQLAARLVLAETLESAARAAAAHVVEAIARARSS